MLGHDACIVLFERNSKPARLPGPAGITRRGTKFDTCKLAGDTRVSTYFHHQGEELIYRGRLGSGTIFFTSCNMRCAGAVRQT